MEIRWRDKSFRMSTDPERWVPEAIIEMIEGGTTRTQPVYLSEDDSERIKRGELVYSTKLEAKAATQDMVRKAVWNEWRIPGEGIQEYDPR